VLYGAADAVDGMVLRIRAEWPGSGAPRAVATGGLARLVAPLCRTIDDVDYELTLNGLRIAAGHLGLSW
jgi:type III pantothenate kinase